MQKVIINKCFGGYGFEPFTIQKYAEAKGVKLIWYTRDHKYDARYPKEKWVKTNIEEIEREEGLRMENLPLVDDMGDSFIFDLSGDMFQRLVYQLPQDHESRTDPILIEIIERYGDMNRHGCHAPTVIEVPDGVEWIIYEYDGLESLHEAHRVFG